MTTAPAPVFSIVLPTLNEGSLLHMTTESIAEASADVPHEVLVVDDGSTDGSTAVYANGRGGRVRLIHGGGLGVARARNRGAREARGEYLLFMDAHCRVSTGWLQAFRSLLSVPDVGLAGPAFTKLETPVPRGCGMRWPDHSLDPCWFEPADGDEPYCVPLTTGACQVFRRGTFEELGGYDDQFSRWGFEDVEMCLRTWLMGYRVAVSPGVTVAHFFRESRDNYEVDDLDVTCNFLRMVYLHFSPTRIQKVLRAVSGNSLVRAAQDRLVDSDVFEAREGLLRRRVRDDEWFFAEVNGSLDEARPA
jgi:glycosyltransferase involved in cell wall biosynthesis